MLRYVLVGMLFGGILVWLITDDVYEAKLNDFYREQQAQHYINEAEKIRRKNEKI